MIPMVPMPDELIHGDGFVLNMPAEHQPSRPPGWWLDDPEALESLRQQRALQGISVLDFADLRFMPAKDETEQDIDDDAQ